MANKESHKAMQANYLTPAVLERYLRLYHLAIDPNADFSHTGGMVYDQTSGDPIRYFRNRQWRADPSSSELSKSDLRRVYDLESDKGFNQTETGSELELYLWSLEAANTVDVMQPETGFTQALDEINNSVHFVHEDKMFDGLLSKDWQVVGYSAELAKSQLELNFHHSEVTQQTTLAMLRSLRHVRRVAQGHGAYILPVAVLPNRKLTPADVNPDQYVQRIAQDYMGLENVLHFSAAAFQVHVEMVDIASGAEALNQYQHVSDLLYGITLAGPFAYGEVSPNLAEHFLVDEAVDRRLQDHETYQSINNNNGFYSARYVGRWRGSPSGGVFTEALPKDKSQILELIEHKLQVTEPHSVDNIPSPARVAGHHRDRLRIDIPPHGTIELCNFDSDGGHVARMGSLQEFVRVLQYKLQMYAREGRMPELYHAYPSLFGPVTKEGLRAAHFNSIAVGQHGLDALTLGPDGKTYNSRQRFQELFSFVMFDSFFPSQNEYCGGLPTKVAETVWKAAQDPSSYYFDYLDEDSLISSRGFYQSGLGTLSHWQKARAAQLKELGWPDHAIIKNCMADLALSYHSHLDETTPEDIKQLFEE